MRTFDSRHYDVVGYGPVSIQDHTTEYWILRNKPNPRFTNDDESQILVGEAKFVDAGIVYFLKSDGRVEDRSRSTVALPALVSR